MISLGLSTSTDHNARAGRDLAIESATENHAETHFKKTKQSGVFGSGGVGFTIGSKMLSTDQQGTGTTAAASTVGSTSGNVVLKAGETYRQVGSDVIAPSGDIEVTAKTVDILEARETNRTTFETKMKQSGLTVAITSPIISAIQTAQQMSEAAKDTKDSRMQLLAAANVGLSAYSTYDAIKAGQGTTMNGLDNQMPVTNDQGKVVGSRDATAGERVGGVNLSISIGSSSSSSKTTQTSNAAAGSTLQAGGDLTITATGAGEQSDITVQGSDLAAGKNLTLKAEDEIALLAAANTAEQHSTNKSNSASVGFSIGTDGFLVNVGASKGSGKADGTDLVWTNSHATAGETLTLQSGGDTTLKGAVAQGEQVVAKVGGPSTSSGQANLLIESLQDQSSYDSKQKSAGFSVSVGYGKVSGSVSMSQSKVKSDYVSVTEQSGFKAGDAGFQVKVEGDTTLKGAVIASSQRALDEDRNEFETGGVLSTEDIRNHAEYEAKSASVNLGSSLSFDGKLKPGGTGAGFGKDNGQAESTTRSGITGIAGNTEVRTGDPESGIKKIFDQEKVQKEIEAQTRITQLFSQYAIKEVSVHTEAAYKAMFKNEAKFYQVSCSATPMECLNDPKLIVMQEITIDDAKQNGKVLAVNGILNGDSRAAQLAYQNVPEDQSTGQKPDSLTLMHIAPADTGFGELLVAGYEKFLASTFGYTIADTTYADALQGRGDLETLSLGHSRGTIVQKNALDIVASMGYVNQGLSVFGVGGAVGYEEYAASARKVIKLDDTKQLEQQIIYTYFANDPVSVIAAGNPGDAISAFKDLSNVIKTSNSAHSCYGTGAKDCSTIANPVPGGPTPTNQNSDLIRVYRNGKLAQSGQH